MRWLALLPGTFVAAAACSGGQSARDADLVSDGLARIPDSGTVAKDGDGSPDLGSTCGASGMRPGAPCFSDGFGACINQGTVTCADGSKAVCSASPGTPDDNFHSSAAPNGSWDWNCKNGVDRKYPLASCESFTNATCPAFGWSAQPGASGDCGEQLIQQPCSATASGCASAGAGNLVTEECN